MSIKYNNVKQSGQTKIRRRSINLLNALNNANTMRRVIQSPQLLAEILSSDFEGDFWESEIAVSSFVEYADSKGSDIDYGLIDTQLPNYGIYFGESGTYDSSRMSSKEIKFTIDASGLDNIRLISVSLDGTARVGIEINGVEVIERGMSDFGSRGDYEMPLEANGELTSFDGEVEIVVYSYLHSTIQPEVYVFDIEVD